LLAAQLAVLQSLRSLVVVGKGFDYEQQQQGPVVFQIHIDTKM
jgi:hypothetical protein